MHTNKVQKSEKAVLIIVSLSHIPYPVWNLFFVRTISMWSKIFSSLLCFMPSSEDSETLEHARATKIQSAKDYVRNILEEAMSINDISLALNALNELTIENQESLLDIFDTSLLKGHRKSSVQYYKQSSLLKDLEHIMAQRCKGKSNHLNIIADVIKNEELLVIVIIYLLWTNEHVQEVFAALGHVIGKYGEDESLCNENHGNHGLYRIFYRTNQNKTMQITVSCLEFHDIFKIPSSSSPAVPTFAMSLRDDHVTNHDSEGSVLPKVDSHVEHDMTSSKIVLRASNHVISKVLLPFQQESLQHSPTTLATLSHSSTIVDNHSDEGIGPRHSMELDIGECEHGAFLKYRAMSAEHDNGDRNDIDQFTVEHYLGQLLQQSISQGSHLKPIGSSHSWEIDQFSAMLLLKTDVDHGFEIKFIKQFLDFHHNHHDEKPNFHQIHLKDSHHHH